MGFKKNFDLKEGTKMEKCRGEGLIMGLTIIVEGFWSIYIIIAGVPIRISFYIFP